MNEFPCLLDINFSYTFDNQKGNNRHVYLIKGMPKPMLRDKFGFINWVDNVNWPP